MPSVIDGPTLVQLRPLYSETAWQDLLIVIKDSHYNLKLFPSLVQRYVQIKETDANLDGGLRKLVSITPSSVKSIKLGVSIWFERLFFRVLSL